MFQSPSLIRRILHEPLIHFLLLAGLLFVCDALLSEDKKEQILVDSQTAQYVIRQREDLELRPLSPEEKQAVVENYVADEILYREAYKRGLDKSDTRMRRNLILKMRGLITDEVKTPDETEIRNYFELNREQYTVSAKISLEQIFFTDPDQIPEGLLEQLNQGLIDPGSLGDIRLGLGRRLPNRSKVDIIGTFGPQAAPVILSIEDERWVGPIESIRGIHFVRVVGRSPEKVLDFEQVKDYLEKDWTIDQSRKIVQKEIQQLRNNYDIVMEDWTGEAQ